MGRSCFVCGAKYPLKTLHTSTSSKSFALHSFPQHADTCAAWKAFCGLPSDYPFSDLKNRRICSSHFTALDYIDIGAKLVGGSRLTLKPGAVPSGLSQWVEAVSNDSVTSLIDQQTLVITSPAESPHNLYRGFTYDRQLPLNEPCSAENSEDILTTPKRRKFANPRFISEVEIRDLATPARARRILKFIKSEDKKKTEKIKALQKKNNYLRKRVRILENLVKSLRKKGLVSEESGGF